MKASEDKTYGNMDSLEEKNHEETTNSKKESRGGQSRGGQSKGPSLEEEFEEFNLEAHKDPRVQQIVQELTNYKSDSDGDNDDNDRSESKKDDDEDGSGDESGDEECVIRTNDMIHNPESYLNKWLMNHGKEHYINFKEEELKQLRTYFNSLDSDGGGSIGIDELENPLIALGLVDSR